MCLWHSQATSAQVKRRPLKSYLGIWGWRLFAEPVVDNRFLAAYYGDMKRWAFTLKLGFDPPDRAP